MTTDDGQRTAAEMRAEIIAWSKQLRQQDRDRKLRAGKAMPRNQRETAIFMTDLLRESKKSRDNKGGAPE